MCTPNQLIEGLQILVKYDSKHGNHHTIDSDHDVIYTNIGDEAIPTNSPDRKRLEELGWSIEGDVGCWCRVT